MFLSPSNIYFTHCEGGQALPDITNDTDMEELSKRLLKNGECPKLQVAEKDGHYFTLNNTRLQVFRWLESSGRCKRVKVDRVPLRVIPEGIRKLMTIGSSTEALDEAGESRMKTITYKPVEQRKTCWSNDDDDDNEDGNGSDDTDEDESESDCARENPGTGGRSSDEQSGEEDSLL